MKKFSSKRLALAGISSALALVCVIASFYVKTLTITFNVLAGIAIMLPLTQKYYREAILSYIAVCGLGAIFANISILSFVLVGGFYTILTVFLEDKSDKIKWYISYPIKIVYASFVFFVLYYLTDVLFIDFDAMGIVINMGEGLLYFVLNLLFVAIAIVYDFLLLWIYRWLQPLVEKITKNLH